MIPASTDHIYLSYHRNGSLRETFVKQLRDSINHSSYWRENFNLLIADKAARFHLGIFVEPFLQYILDGRKTVESRFSINRSPPYSKVQAGDVLLLKRSGGPVVGLCHISHVWSYELTPIILEEIKQTFSSALCLEGSDFWQRKKEANYATLMAIDQITCFHSLVYIDKRDRRGWVILD